MHVDAFERPPGASSGVGRWEAGCEKGGAPFIRPTDAPKSNNFHSPVRLGLASRGLDEGGRNPVGHSRCATDGPKPCSPCRKISPSRTPLPTRSHASLKFPSRIEEETLRGALLKTQTRKVKLRPEEADDDDNVAAPPPAKKMRA